MNNYNKSNKYLFKKIFSFINLKKGLTVLFCFLNFIAYLQKTDSIYPQKYYYNSGQISSEGNIENRLPTGLWKNYYESGILKSEGEKKGGKSEGKWIFYTSQGKIEKEIEYAGNLKNGRFQQFDSTGKIIQENWYKNDTLIQISKSFQNGKLIIETTYENGLKTGVEKIFDEQDGRLLETINYSNNEQISNLVVNQFDAKKQKKGLWRNYYPDGKLKNECFYENDKVIGNCKEWNEKGLLIHNSSTVDITNTIDIRQTLFSNGKISKFQAYEGKFKNGVGSEYDSLGNLIRSEIYKLDTLLAQGFILSSGIYDSNWVFYHSNLQIASTGKYKNGIKTGEWIYFNEQGKVIQKGKYRKGNIDGEWFWYFDNGQLKRRENYISGSREGISIEYDSLGNKIAEGIFVNDLPNGQWYYEKNSLTEVGLFDMGLKEGEWKHFYKEKTLCFKGSFKSNIPIGKHYFYFNNGQIMKYGKYKKGSKNGEWRTFNKEGVFIHTNYYVKGVLVSVDGDKSIHYEK